MEEESEIFESSNNILKKILKIVNFIWMGLFTINMLLIPINIYLADDITGGGFLLFSIKYIFLPYFLLVLFSFFAGEKAAGKKLWGRIKGLIIISFIISSMFIFFSEAGLLVFINNNFAKSELKKITVEVITKNKTYVGKSGTQYRVIIKEQDKILELLISSTLYEKINKGTKLKLGIYKGCLGAKVYKNLGIVRIDKNN